MSNQPAPARPWFRLASIARPVPPQAPAPTPEPAPAPPRPAAAVRPTFRPGVQPGAAAPPAGAGVSSVPTSPVSTVGRASQPSSPATVGRASQPSSPADKKPTTSSVPNSPARTVQTTSPPKTGTTASLPSSPARTTGSVPSSPVRTAVATTASLPSSPAKPAVVTTASLPTSPAKTTSFAIPPTQTPAAAVTTATTRVRSPTASVTTVKPAAQTPIQSPKTKPPTAPPPSPLLLPPSQLKAQAEVEPKIPAEAEQKTVLVQTRLDKPKPEPRLLHAQKDYGHDALKHGKTSSKEGETKEKGHHGKKIFSDSEDSGMRVITIAGENKGAVMELISSPQRNGFQGGGNLREQRRANFARTGSDASDYHSYSSSSSSEEGRDRKSRDKSKTSKTMPMNAFMNSNVQGVNNSIVFNSSCTHHDPGVHLSLHRKPFGGGFHVKERTNGYSS
ncbi:hypothetical protein CCACVL1_21910 [Corchorus capsularis]|uniref:Uncharacterized protein n=1 Tax=Corchorus capsularis TaxID=210143 RepID=A0A1R3H1M6_COCAP|nr:hypothetical protein CCACVL1_21910 [Corchorus capsularis]